MDNPLELPVPDDPVKRIETLARDLAYGAIQSMWGSSIRVIYQSGKDHWEAGKSQHYKPLDDYLRNKWRHNHPGSDVMLSFDYFSVLSQSKADQTVYYLTPKAFALLAKPATPPFVFISYKRNESSALGLLILTRLKLEDNGIDVFIDKELEPGDEWHGRLEKEVRQRPNFVCLLGPMSLRSKFVRNEIEWALDEAEKDNTVIIPICHNGYHFDATLQDELQKDAALINPLIERLRVHNAIVINPEGAEQYQSALNRLMNKLGYATI